MRNLLQKPLDVRQKQDKKNKKGGRTMSYKSLSEALGSIAMSVRTVKGKRYEQWGVYLGRNAITAEPKRMWASSKENLECAVRDFYKTIRKGGEIQTILTAKEITDARMALESLRAANLSLSLLDCVKRTISQISAVRCTMTVAECFAAYMKEKDTSALDRREQEIRVGKWVELRGATPIVEVTTKMVTDDLAQLCNGLSATTYNGRLTYISTFFNWCMKKPRSWIKESPLEGVSKKKQEWKEPPCIGLDSFRILLKEVYERRDTNPEYVAYIALSFFCGMRSAEIMRWAGKNMDGTPFTEEAVRINFDTKTIAVLKPKGYTKGVKPRAFTVPDTALAWLRLIDLDKALKRMRVKSPEWLYDIARKHKAVIPKNCGRHSFITYHVCAYENLAKTLMVAGTSEGMSESHYRSLKSHDEGVAYFAITPAVFANPTCG